MFFKKLSRKNRNYLNLILGGILVVVIPLVLATLKNPNTAKAAWYDDNWTYRQTVALTNSGSAQTDFQVSITVDTATLITAGKMQSDCDDIRVVDNNGKVLPYWIETGNNACNTSTTAIWVKVPSISTTGNTLFVYYGNASAVSLQNGNAVFAFFDDFSGSSIDSAKWTSSTAGTASITVTGGTVEVSSNLGQASITGKVDITNNFILEKRIKYVDSPALDRNRFGPGSTPGQDHGIFWHSASIEVFWNGAWSGTAVTTDQYYRDKRTHDGSTFTWTITTDAGAAFYSNSISNSLSGSQYPSMTTGDGPATAGGDMFIDWVFARKYAATLPTVASPTNEEKGTGPVAYWKFDEGTGTNAKDSTQSGNNGTISNGTWQTDDLCVTGKCLLFNGSTTTVTVADASQKGLDPGTNSFTLSAWIRTGTSSNQDIINKNDGANGSAYLLGIRSTGKIQAFIGNGTTSFTTTSTSTIYDNQWHYIAAVYNRSGNVQIYIDGKADGSPTDISSISASSLNATSRFTIGADSAGATPFNGFIDDVKVYPYARTAAQVTTDYNSKGSVKGASTQIGSDPQNSSALNQGLVGYWKMDESSGNAADSSGNGTTLTNNAVTTYAAGKFGNAGSFAKASTQYFSAVDSSTLRVGTGNFTIASWVYLNTATVEMAIASKYDTASKREWVLEYNFTDQRFEFIMSPDGTAATTVKADNLGAPATGQWYFVVGWYDGVNMNISVNGGTPNSAAYTTGTTSNTAPFEIGGLLVNGVTTLTWDGKIDDVRLYKRALSTADISTLYNFAPGPVGYWKMDENTGASANDSSGNGQTGTLTSGPTWTQGKVGSALSFDGSTNYVSVANTTNLQPLSEDWSVGFWMYRTGSGAGDFPQIIGSRPWTANTDKGWAVTWDSVNNKICSHFADGSAGFDVNTGNSCSASTTTLNTWEHWLVVFDRANGKLKYYKNGTLDANLSPTGGFPTGSINQTNTIYLGREIENANNRKLAARLDDVKVYNYARTQQQTVQDMNAGHPAPGSPVGSAVGYWKFDEGYGITANNAGNGGSTLNGTLTGMASPATATSGWTNSGKFSKALVFDGSNDYVNISNTGGAVSSGDFSVSGWIYPTTIPTGANDAVIVDLAGSSTSERIYVAIQTGANSGKLTCNGYDGTVRGVYNTGPTLSANNWYHFTCAVDSSGNYTLYLNGVSKATSSSTNVSATSPTMAIGSLSSGAGGPGRYFTGTIDEVKIYSSALTASQVLLDMNRSQAQVLGALSQNNNTTDQPQASSQEYCIPGDTTTSCAAPVGRWDFEEGTGNSVNDKSGNANTGTWNGTLGNQWKVGKIGTAGNFDGSTNFVNLPNATSLEGTGSHTIEAWTKYNATMTGGTVFIKDQDGGTGGWGMSMTQGATGATSCHVVVTSPSTAQKDTANVTVSSGWHHLACVWNNGVNLKLYVDGIDSATLTTASTTLRVSNQPSAIGKDNGVSTYYGGQIDQVRLFNYARTPAQIAWDYNKGGPVGYWKFDECQGTVANDSSGNGNTGTITPGSGGQTAVGTCTGSAGTMWADGATGKFNSSLDFDGTDDYIQIADSSSLSLGGGPVSIFAWVKGNSMSSTQTIIRKENTDYVLATVGSKVWCELSNQSFVTNAGSSMSDGNWYFIGCTFDGTTLKSYLNGVEQGSDSTGTFATDSNGVLSIGRDNNGTQYFNGQIDDVRIYNYALTATQVKTLMNQGGAIRYGPATGAP